MLTNYKLTKKDNGLLKKLSSVLFFAATEAPSESALLDRYALQYYFIIIGEIVKKLPEEFKSAFGEIDWNRLIAIRNIVLHQFHWIDEDLFLKSARTHLPALRDAIRSIYHSNTIQISEENTQLLGNMMQDVVNSVASKTKEMKKEQNKEKKRKRISLIKEKGKGEEETLESALNLMEPAPVQTIQGEKNVKRLDIILLECTHIREFMAIDPELNRSNTVSAIKMAMMIVGLLVREHLTDAFKAAYPLNIKIEPATKSKERRINWRSLIMIRNELTHNLEDTNPMYVRNTALIFEEIVPYIEAIKRTVQEQLQKQMKIESESFILETEQKSSSSSGMSDSAISSVSSSFSVTMRQEHETVAEKETKHRKLTAEEDTNKSFVSSPTL